MGPEAFTGGVTYSISLVIFSFFFQNDQNTGYLYDVTYQNTGYLYDVTFVFDGCHHSWAAETPDRYQCDWKYGI